YFFVGIFSLFSRLVKLIGNLQSSKDGDSQGIHRHCCASNLAHAIVHIVGELLNVGRVVIAAKGICLVIDDYLDRLAWQAIHDLTPGSVHLLRTSATSGSTTEIASSIASILSLIISRSFRRRSI